MDSQLAALPVTDAAYAAANQLRAAWRLERIASLDPAGQAGLTKQALAIVDAALRVETTTDLLMQRATLAQVLGNNDMLVETGLAFAQMVSQGAERDLEARRAQALIAALSKLPASTVQKRAIAALNSRL
jgi:spermidine synthase